MHPTFRQTFVYKMYKKMYTKYIPHFDKFLETFCIQNLAGIVLLILYIACIQRFDEMWYMYILYTFCVHQLYTSCTISVYKMYIHSFHVCSQGEHKFF